MRRHIHLDAVGGVAGDMFCAALLDALMSGRRGAELALRHGYYDQAHLARDLRLLAGDPLTQLLAQAAQPVSEQWPLQLGKRWAGSATTARP